MMKKVLTSFFLFLFLSLTAVRAQLPSADGERMRCGIEIDLGRAYLSGVCLLLGDGGGNVKGSIVNEFGVSYVDFSYSPGRRKVKLHSVAGPMDRWYIRLALRHDLRGLLAAMERGGREYAAGKRKWRVYSVRS